MSKKTDSPGLLASPAVSPSGGTRPRTAHVSGAVLQRTRTPEPEPSPAAAEPLPATRWPPVDQYLDEPDEVERWERIDGRRKKASPATPKHGDPHFKLDALLDAHLAEGLVGSTDLKTRVDEKREYASDTCVRRPGPSATASRHLEELVFEVVHKRSKAETDARARGFAARGVRRQVGIFVEKNEVREWDRSREDWGEPLNLQGSLEDPCLAVPLPLAALFDRELATKAIARALEAKDDPTILEMKRKSEAKGLVKGLLAVLSTRGLAISEETRERIEATTDVETLERWLRRATSAASLDEVMEP